LKGGVHICATPEEVKEIAGKMIGHRIFTIQTGVNGRPCNKVYLVERKYIRRESYLSIILDRESGGPLIIASPQGGVNIEIVAKENSQAVAKIPIDIVKGITKEHAQQVSKILKYTGKQAQKVEDIVFNLYKLFTEKDATLVEVNPLIESPEGEILCLDAKINFDDNALYRQQDLVNLRDTTQEDPRDVAASNADLNYIGLEGNIACLVNGAGLAMATMDMIKIKGGSPANFLDVGGGATEHQVREAFKLIVSDKQVKAILVNIFGGIMRCDIIALGIIGAAKNLDLKIPVIVRLEGTNSQKGKELIDNSGFKIISADDLEEAALKAVKIAQITSLAEEAQIQIKFELPI